LEDYVWPVVSGWENIDELLYMHDGAPPHFALSVRAWLDQKFPGRWLGRRGTQEGHARSADFTPCDFSCGARERRRCSGQNLAQWNNWRIGIGTLSHDFLQKTVDSITGHLRKLVDAADTCIEYSIQFNSIQFN